MSAVASTAPSVITDLKPLLAAVSRAAGVAPKKATAPTLSTVKLQATGRKLTVEATDLDFVYEGTINADATEPFTVLLPADRLSKILKKAEKGKQVVITPTGEDSANISIGALTVSLSCGGEAIKDFPDMPSCNPWKQKTKTTFHIKASQLQNALESVRFAVSTEETRYYLNGVFLDISLEERALRFVATDGHKLSCFKVKMPGGCEKLPAGHVIIPTDLVDEVLASLKSCDASADIDVCVGSDYGCVINISFLFPTEKVYGKLVDAQYPDWRRVTTQPTENLLRGASKALRDAIKGLAAVREKSGCTEVSLIDEETADLHMKSDGAVGKVRISSGITVQGTGEIGFNSDYLDTILAKISGDAIIRFDEPGSPALIEDSSCSAWFCILMPMRF